jgi:hypothetical protein
MSQREVLWKERADRDVERRKQLEENYKQKLKEAQEANKKLVMIGPDCEASESQQLFNILDTVFILNFLFHRKDHTAH